MNDLVTFDEAVEKGREWGASAPLAPLNLIYEMVDTEENIERNIRRTLESDYRPFNEWVVPVHDRPISIVGFGPSLKRTWQQLEGDVWACNGAHNWLIERGIVPKFAMFWDPVPDIAKFIKPHKDVNYMVASRCHADVFEALKGYNVFVWHALGDKCLDDLLCEYQRAEPMLPGGSAAVTRAMVIVTTMGYRTIRMFGADSSFDGEFTHVHQSIVPEEVREIWCGGRMFRSTLWLAGQVEDFKKLAPTLREQGNQIEFYSDGLMPHVARMHGFTVHESPNANHLETTETT